MELENRPRPEHQNDGHGSSVQNEPKNDQIGLPAAKLRRWGQLKPGNQLLEPQQRPGVHLDHADVSRLMLTMFLSPVLVLEALMALLPSYMTSAKAVTMSRPPPGSGHACC